ncbi:MAG: hypothetical protein WBJ84_07895 [Bacteroidales bacterium]
MNRLIVRIILTVVIIVLGYFIVESILKPVRFQKELQHRKSIVVSQMKDLRSIQLTYRVYSNNYASSFDTLLDFLRNADIPVVKIVPDPNDTTFTKTINDTIAYVRAADSLLKHVSYSIDSLPYIPFSGGEKFELDAGRIERGGVMVNVFEAKAHFNTFLKGLDDQLLRNLVASEEQIGRYPGLRLGSMTEPSTDGNWE